MRYPKGLVVFGCQALFFTDHCFWAFCLDQRCSILFTEIRVFLTNSTILDFFVVENLDTLISASNLILNCSISFLNQTS